MLQNLKEVFIYSLCPVLLINLSIQKIQNFNESSSLGPVLLENTVKNFTTIQKIQNFNESSSLDPVLSENTVKNFTT